MLLSLTLLADFKIINSAAMKIKNVIQMSFNICDLRGYHRSRINWISCYILYHHWLCHRDIKYVIMIYQRWKNINILAGARCKHWGVAQHNFTCALVCWDYINMYSLTVDLLQPGSMFSSESLGNIWYNEVIFHSFLSVLFGRFKSVSKWFHTVTLALLTLTKQKKTKQCSDMLKS